MKRTIIIIASVLLLCLPAQAQFAVAVKGDIADFSNFDRGGLGAQLLLGKEFRTGVLQLGLGGRFHRIEDAVSVTDTEEGASERTDHSVKRLTLSLSYMSRLYGNAGHSFNVYAGLGAFGGYDLAEAYSVTDPETAETTTVDDSAFCAGAFPEIQLEVFLFNTLAFFADVQAPYSFMGALDRFSPQYGAGFRYLIPSATHE